MAMRSPHTEMQSSPRSMQLEKAYAEQQRLTATKNEQIKILNKQKFSFFLFFFFFKEIIKVVGCVEKSSSSGETGWAGRPKGHGSVSRIGFGRFSKS